MENKLLEALKGIERLCDNQNPTHENIWRIAHAAIQEAETGAQWAAVASEGEGEANMRAENLWEILRDLEMGKLSAKYVFDKVRSA